MKILTLIILASLTSCVSLQPKQKVVYKKAKFKSQRKIKDECFERKFKDLGLKYDNAITACKYILKR